MRIPRNLIDQIVAHARETAPEECCGVLTGSGRDATHAERAENEFAHRMRYRIAPDELYRLTMLASERGEDVIATYHSHPRSEAYPSQTDINEVRNWDESLHLICSLEDPDAPVVRAFLIRGPDVEELELDHG